ncbi:MAG: 2-oxoacid:acceptor oxidoreductase family protein, partial [Candidatus Helarchaeales archaeon]
MNEIYKIRFSGQGGQGIVTSSIIFGNAAVKDGYHAVQTQSYGPEQRGSKL